MRKVLGITLAGDGFDAAICKSGAEALQLAQAKAPDVAIVDAYLAGENGYELCAKLRSLHPGLEVLILSSKQRPYDEGAGRTAGAAGNFDKPFDSQKLIDKIQSLSSGSPARAPSPQVSAPASSFTAPVAAAPVPERASVSVPRPGVSFSGNPAPRPQVPTGPAVQSPSISRAAVAAPPAAQVAPSKAPMASVAAQAANVLGTKLNGLGLSAEQVQAVLALSKEVVEQVVWEVVPALAETMIKEEIRRLTADAR